MFYFRNADFDIPNSLLINGVRKKLHFNDLNADEFISICINDCYHLNDLKKQLKKVNSIVDIGANQGMFLIAARQNFPDARITGYEPNIQLQDVLNYNASQLGCEVFYEAVMKNDCKVSLNLQESDLATTVSESESGSVSGTSFKKVIKRAGIIDILKLDCEGAEWELLEDIDSWKNVKAVTLEYHLWNVPGINHSDMSSKLKNIGFEIIAHAVLSEDQGLLAATNENFLG